MPITNTSSTERALHAERVYLIARLASGPKLESYHTEHNGHCALHGCGQVWPCDGRRLAEQVIELQGG